MSQTVQRAILIIESLAARPRTLGEVADILGVHRSTALRLLQTLEASGFARRLGDGRHAVGTRLIAIAQQTLETLDLRPLASPHLRALHGRHGHTIHLAQLIGDEVIYVDKLESTEGVRMYSRIGRPASLHASGVGKAILSCLPAGRLDELLSGVELTAHTANTLSTRQALDAELATIRERGWAVDDGEFEDFTNCVAAPVRNSTGDIVAALSITSLRVIAPLTELVDLVPDLLATARAISRELG
ncbi:IclR family transcriptional regulator [Marinactinospora thermotolerans]|uniref:Transcriptional regulator, IclR family n=1 Tax=Marinactinospora thermotolerans DSM 45154 TaxID=1122192 RepID=A0A1T4N798_9ACTN|nr:IclR family transcriptional regulator [Marinactinospora thermotolerans]SJZ75170.1 transcriptional regulator, IclR family [Marinactinospora thermotolerans DSM 45154]